MTVSLLLGCMPGFVSAHHTEGFHETDLNRPDGGAWQEAVGVTFQESGRTWVWERGGRVWIIDDVNPVTTPFLNISDEVGSWHDHGMLGFALDPDFSETGYVYLLYVVDRHHLLHCVEVANGQPSCDTAYNPATDQYFDATIGRLTRYRAKLPSGSTDFESAVEVDPASRTVLIGATPSTGIPSTSRSRATGALVFGTDRTLLISTGDGAQATIDFGSSSTTGDHLSYNSQALADGIIDTAQDVGANRAQMVDSLSGKILRIDPDTGLGLPSNPWYDAAAPNAVRSKVWALGLRNPYRFTLRPDTGSHNPDFGDPGRLIVGDVGRQVWEEINFVDAPGQNFGWPIYEGMNRFTGTGFAQGQIDNVYAANPLFGINGCTEAFFQFNDLIVQESANAAVFPNPCNVGVPIAASTPTHMHIRPVLSWRHQSATTKAKGFDATGTAIDWNINDPASPIQGTPFSGATVTGGVVVGATNFPPEYHGNYFFGDYSGQWIRRLEFDASGSPSAVHLFSDGAETGGVVHLATSPVDGGLYFIPWTIAVKQLIYAPNGNFPPQANIFASPVYGPSPLTTQFDAGASTDPEGLPLTYHWDFGDGASASTAITEHSFVASGIGSYPVTLTVTDAAGGQDQAQIVISPNNSPPSVSILSPVDGTSYPMWGDTRYDLIADIRDTEHPLADMQCVWDVRLYHNTHFHGGPPIEGCVSEAVIAPEGCDGDNYFWEIRVTVTDPAGLVGSDVATLAMPDCGPGNFAPVANGDLAEVEEGAAVDIAVLDNDIDDSGLLANSVELTGAPPEYGNASVDPISGRIAYQHGGEPGSVDTFRYRVADTDGSWSNEATVVVRSVVPPPPSVTVPAMQDTYTRSNAVTLNFGTETLVRVQKWGNSTGFLRFDLSSLPAGSTVSAATLRLRVNTVTLAGSVRLHKVLGPWSELTLTDSNKPALGPLVSSFNVSPANNGQTLELDVTGLINQLLANPANDFGLALSPGDVNVWFNSRESGMPAQLVLNPGGPQVNAAPVAVAGSDFSTVIGGSATLNGSASDDGLPNPPGAVSVTWSKVSGPGSVTFTNPVNAQTSVGFATIGSYVLRLTADDGELQHSDEISVTVVEPSAQQTLATVQDTYTRSNAVTLNFGTETLVRVQKWGNSTGFLRFDLSSLPAGSTVSAATLRLRVNTVTLAGSVRLHKVLGPWSELTLTDSNKPALGPLVSSFNVSPANNGQTLELDVTGLINQLLANPANDFGLALSPGDVNVWFNSRESGMPAQLVLNPGGPQVNAAPVAVAGSDFSTVIGGSATLNGSASDDGLPNPPGAVSVTWSKVSGPGSVTFTNPVNAQTSVGFATIGSYVLRLTADDGELQHSDEISVTVVVPPPPSVTVPAMQDTYTRSNAVTLNFGTETLVRVQKWGNSTGFLRFDLSSLPAGSTVSAATLRLRVNTVTLAGSVRLHKVLGPWSELTLTDSNKPALGPLVSSFNVSPANNGQTLELDVTGLINQLLANPANDFGLALSPGDVNVWFNSRESGMPALLLIVNQ